MHRVGQAESSFELQPKTNTIYMHIYDLIFWEVSLNSHQHRDHLLKSVDLHHSPPSPRPTASTIVACLHHKNYQLKKTKPILLTTTTLQIKPPHHHHHLPSPPVITFKITNVASCFHCQCHINHISVSPSPLSPLVQSRHNTTEKSNVKVIMQIQKNKKDRQKMFLFSKKISEWKERNQRDHDVSIVDLQMWQWHQVSLEIYEALKHNFYSKLEVSLAPIMIYSTSILYNFWKMKRALLE